MKQFFLLILGLIPLLSWSQDTTRRQKAVGLTASLPWCNNYSYYNYYEQQSTGKSGFVGLGAAAFYITGKNKFSLNFGMTGDLPAPIGAFDYGKTGVRTNILSNIWEGLYHRTVFQNAEIKANIITGVNYVKYRFDVTSYVDTIPSYSVFDKTIGFTIGGECQVSKHFALAVLYRPAIISLDQKHYRHVISLDARFDIYLWQRKKTTR